MRQLAHAKVTDSQTPKNSQYTHGRRRDGVGGLPFYILKDILMKALMNEEIGLFCCNK
jgi:hypothetical protein